MTRLLAEWQPQAGILLTWPYNKNDWGDLLQSVQTFYLKTISLLTQTENVIVLCENNHSAQYIKDCLAQQAEHSGVVLANLRFLTIPSNDIWVRDYGPLSVQSHQQTQRHCFQFNAWGNKYPHASDSQINTHLAQDPILGKQPWFFHEFVLEGGAIESNGQHLVIANRDCVLNRNRTALTTAEYEQILTHTLGLKKFFWLEQLELAGDDTDGHIDNFVRFSSEKTIVYLHTDRHSDPHFQGLQTLEKQLQHYCQASRQPLELVKLPLPQAVYGVNGQRLPASYLNFLITNKLVLVPQFNVAEDTIALETLTRLFPEHRVVGLVCTTLLHQGGGIHCASMQLAL